MGAAVRWLLGTGVGLALGGEVVGAMVLFAAVGLVDGAAVRFGRLGALVFDAVGLRVGTAVRCLLGTDVR